MPTGGRTTITSAPPVSRGDDSCSHLAHWRVDVDSRRVVRQPCALCQALGRSGSDTAVTGSGRSASHFERQVGRASGLN